jgi:PAS domain S-box-containing protein
MSTLDNERDKPNNHALTLAEQRHLLLNAAQALVSASGYEAVQRQLYDTLQEVMPGEQIALYWLDATREVLFPTLSKMHHSPQQLASWEIPFGVGIIGGVARSGVGQLVNNAQLDPRSVYPPGISLEREHMLVTPIRANETTFGVIVVTRIDDPPFSAEEFELLQLVSSYAALALANNRLLSEARTTAARYRTLVETTGSMIVCLDPLHRILEFNPAAERLTGYRREEVLGRDYFELFLPPQQWQATAADIRKVLGGEPTESYEDELQTRSGQILTLIWNVTRMVDAQGKPSAIIAIGQDISARRQAETSRQLFERKVQELQKLESLHALAGGIAHDFNNLLTIIAGHVELLASDLTDPAQQASVLAIDHAAQRAAALTRQMLAYSGRGHFVVTAQDLNVLLETLNPLLRVAAGNMVTLHTTYAPALPPVLADEGQLRQLTRNLVDNAVEAIGVGRGTVTVATATRDLGPQDFAQAYLAPELPPGRYVALSVSDSGCGMDEATRSKMFEPFFSTKFVGRGLGLAAVLGIVRGHQGAIRVESAPGQGTTVTVYLPAMPQGGANRQR